MKVVKQKLKDGKIRIILIKDNAKDEDKIKNKKSSVND